MKNNTFKKFGLRTTALRSALFSILKKSSSPLTVQQLKDALKEQNLTPNKTSLYREIEKLLEKQVIEYAPVLSRAAAFRIKPNTHSHHLVCDTCSTVIDVDTEEIERAIELMEKKIAIREDFEIHGHEISFRGICPSCTHAMANK